MSVAPIEVKVGTIGSQTFFASIDTVIYGRQYTQGETVDTSLWNRKQILQYLGLGLIVGPPVNSEGTPATLTQVAVTDSDEAANLVTVQLPSGVFLQRVQVTGTTPETGTTVTMVTTADRRWVIGSGVPRDLDVDTMRASSLNITADATISGDVSLPKGAEPGWVATSADELGTLLWSPPSDAASGSGAIISDSVAPPSDTLSPGAIWFNPDEANTGPTVWAFANNSSRTSGALSTTVFNSIGQFGGYTITVPQAGLLVCQWSCTFSAAASSTTCRAGMWPTADSGYVGQFVGASLGPASISSHSTRSYMQVSAATDIDWDWRGLSSAGTALTFYQGQIMFTFYPGAVASFTQY